MRIGIDIFQRDVHASMQIDQIEERVSTRQLLGGLHFDGRLPHIPLNSQGLSLLSAVPSEI